MIVLSVQNLRKQFGPEPVLDAVTLEVRPGQRVGLVGPNGCGKTTLLRILAGKEEPDAGSFRLHPGVEIGYLEQQPELAESRTVWDEARSALARLIALGREAVQTAHALSQATDQTEHRRLAARFDHVQHELQRHDAYNLDHKVERVLDGLRFARASYGLPVESLSGGEQNRLMLAKLLLAEPDLMLLDEPSNHLDVEATAWLEEFLGASPAAMIVVSHDRYFLDKVTGHTLELFRGTVEAYAGNFSAYWKQKAERLVVQRRTYEKRQTEIAKAEDFIRRHAYGQKHAQAEDRRKKLQRIERVEPPREITAPPMGFGKPQRSGDVVLRAEQLAKAYDRPLFEDATFEIARGQRWGVLGPNGCGKTTLLGCLLGHLEPDAGHVLRGHGLKIGYFDQQLSGLDDRRPLVEAIRADDGELGQQKRRDLLARFGLTGDTALKPAGSLSGGERCRAALARLAAEGANFLVLDEPTNHLDLWALDALEQALRKFGGTVLFVSHDRYFVNQVADHLLVMESGRLRAIEGNYETYLHMAGHEPGPLPGDSRKPAPGKSKKPARAAGTPPAASRRKRRFPYRKVADIEAEIFEQEGRLEQFHALLAEPDTYRQAERIRQLQRDIAEQKRSLAVLYEHWEEATELNW